MCVGDIDVAALKKAGPGAGRSISPWLSCGKQSSQKLALLAFDQPCLLLLFNSPKNHGEIATSGEYDGSIIMSWGLKGTFEAIW